MALAIFVSHAPRLFHGVLAAALFTASGLGAWGAPSVSLERHEPCNLFDYGQPIQLQVKLKDFAPGKGQAEVRLVNFDGQQVWQASVPVEIKAGAPTVVNFTPTGLQRGYFEAIIHAQVESGDGKPAVLAESKASIGVMDYVNRTAAEVREKGYRFGLKWWNGVNDRPHAEEAMVKMGFQWTRIIQNQEGAMTTRQMVTDYPMNAIIKVERFPKELYDEARYGPLDEWEKKYGKGSWTLKTLPKKEPYQAWLREQLSKNVPLDQNVFEIWNEPWDKMSPQDLATISQWIADVVLETHPQAILGPNLMGRTGDFEYDAGVIKAGGMDRMKMVALHPYAGSEDRAFLRQYRAWLKEKTGRDIDLYVTEFGSHSTPQGPAKRSEAEQARRVVRQALSLYAEDIKAFTPHWLGQSEANPTYIEDWFGFLRKNEQPKPVLLAYANAARLVDGSRYAGDLWCGPSVGAMLFEKSGKWTLALWTMAEEGAGDPESFRKTVVVEPGVPQVTLVDMIGTSTDKAVVDEKLSLELSEAPIYLVGVNPALASGASTVLREDRWPKPAKPPRPTRIAHRMKLPPNFDGKLDEWKGLTEVGLNNPKVAGLDCSGIACLGWDDQYLYVSANIRDNEILNNQPRAKLYRKDSIELFISTIPRDSGGGFSPSDYQIWITPTSGEGQPIVAVVKDREAGVVADLPDAKRWVGKGGDGWVAEVAIPWKDLGMPQPPTSGSRIALEMRVNDSDTSHERFKVDPIDAPALNVIDPSTWSYLHLAD